MASKAVRVILLSILVLVLGMPVMAQNTKGDRPAPTPRETRFKTPKKTKKTKPATRRVRRGEDRAGKPLMPAPQPAQRRERAGRPVAPQASQSPSKGERPWKGDLTNRRIAPKPSTGRARNVYPQPNTINYSSENVRRSQRDNRNPNVRRVRKMQQEEAKEPKVGKPIRPTFHKTRPQHSERAWRGDITGRKIRATSSDRLRPQPGQPARQILGSGPPPTRRKGILPRISGRAANTQSRRNYYVNANRSRRTVNRESPRTRAALDRLARHYDQTMPRDRTGKVRPRSASASYLARRSTNVWAHFPRPKRKGERAYTRDLAGHKLRTKNFETQRPILTNPGAQLRSRGAFGERPYKGRAAGSHVSRTTSGKAWTGDIAHRRIRGGFRSKKGEPKAGTPIFGRGPSKLDRRTGKYQGNLRGGRIIVDQGEEYTGNIRFRKSEKGGGSISGHWNNKGLPIQGKGPGKGRDGLSYQGNIRGGKVFSDQGEEHRGNIRGGRRVYSNQGEEFRGNLKGGRRVYTYQGEEDRGNIRGGRRVYTNQGEEYSGNIKRGRRVYTDQGEEYRGNIRGKKVFSDQGEEYTGNIKFRKPFKGGGSRSGKLWNNNETPILVRTPTNKAARGAGTYRGDIRGRKVMQDQGEEFAGNIKARRPKKGGGSVSGELWNNNESPIQVRKYDDMDKISRFSGNTKVARADYKRNPNSANDALPVRKASPETLKAGRTVTGVKRDWDYIHNPSSADDAQRTREPGRAFAKSTQFQGHIRLKKFDFFGKTDRHPDAQFVKTNKNNVPEEKDMLTNFKLWWARLFRKAETQPDHLKEKDRKPRYDKGEAGLWYD